ncbi:UNVERIFIED_CONTAM: hypothetical protein GTU68_029139 [Idotea baltica]|nr:hypothetical protein [Idotea baltica]
MPENIRFAPQAHLMSREEMLQIATIFVEEFGIRKIRFTGGEPLLRKDAGPIMQDIAALGTKLAITTNAILLHQYLDQFAEMGLQSLNISLDTLKEDRFLEITRRPEFQQVMDNIQLALDRGFRVKINVVAMQGFNEDELVDFVELGRDKDVHIRFIEFMPFDGNQWNWEKVLPYGEMLNRIGEEFPFLKLEDAPHSTAKAYQVNGFKGTFSVISTITDSFCTSCNRIRLTADGKLRNCLFSAEETDLLSTLRAGGDIRPLIRESIARKHEKLGGLPEFQDEAGLLDALSNRAMVKIGG